MELNPKEKAQELVEKYKPLAHSEWNDNEGWDAEQMLKNAIQCAIIAVEEIINEYENNICNSGYDYDWPMWEVQKNYWNEVLTHLNDMVK